MANITTRTNCGSLYEEKSEEEANDPNRMCLHCFHNASNHPYECKCSICKKWHALVPEMED